jgi:ribose transport system substrate-binding protein
MRLSIQWQRTMIAAVTAAALVTAGCGSSSSDSASTSTGSSTAADAGAGGPDAGGERYRIAMLSASDVIPPFKGYEAGVRRAAEELGVDLEITQVSSLEPADLVAGVDAIAVRRPDAALFSALNDKAMQGAIDQVAQRGSKVVIYDSPPVSLDNLTAYVGSPAARLGEQAADILARLVGERGTVLQTDAIPGNGNLVLNQRAFRRRIEENYPDIDLLPLQWDDGDTARNNAIMKATLARYPDLAGAYVGTSGLGGMGGVSALKEAGKAGDVKVVTLDGLPAAIKELKAGNLQAVTSVKLNELGYTALQTAVKALRGEQVPKEIFSGTCVITSDNVDDADTQECIYPT